LIYLEQKVVWFFMKWEGELKTRGTSA